MSKIVKELKIHFQRPLIIFSNPINNKTPYHVLFVYKKKT